MSGENTYPNPDNYPSPSFLFPVTPPDVDPDEGELISVAYNPEYQPLLMGAMMQLLDPATYQGDHAAKILALNRAENFRFLLTEDIGGGDVPAPYWDSESDADDELPALEQIWYGNMVDGEFVENIGTWIIAGFVAFAATPAAALVFLTIAPKFRLAFKTGDVGGIIQAFIDGADAGTVDTYSASPGIIEKDFVGDPDEETHEIRLVLLE